MDHQLAKLEFLQVKEEPFAGEYFPETVSQPETNFDGVRNELESCCLCPEGIRLQHLLAEHFQTFHSDICDGFVFTHVCNCGESILLQMQLINHLLSHILAGKKEAKSSEVPLPSRVIKFESEAYQEFENTSEPSPRKSRTEKEDEGSDSRMIKRRNKRPAIANDFTIDEAAQKFFCNHCDKHYNTKGKVRQHLHEKHHQADHKTEAPSGTDKMPPPWNDLNPQQCQKCPKVLKSAKHLYQHMLTHREKLLGCDRCGRKFNFKQSLLKHLLVHAGIPRVESSKKTMCEHCSMMLGKTSMKRHILNRHSSFRPFKCDEPGCLSGFKEARALREHKNLHTGEKPFMCEFCDERFHHAVTLRSHRLRHTNPDRFKCGTCGECFVNNQSLKKHTTRQHPTDPATSDIRPFACDHDGCASTFKYREHLTRHKKSVHNKKTVELKCDLCSFAADRRKNFYQHMRRAHDIKKRGRISSRVFPAKNP